MSESSNQHNGPSGTDLSGRELGDFRFLRRLGRGAMAEVYLAEQQSLNRRVAVKVLKSELATDQTYVKRFQREAQAAASLVHANIVQIHEVGCIDNVYYIAQEYVQGLNLRQWMTRNGALDLRMTLIIMRQVAAALAKAAEHGIVHRDIKPENIMITRSLEVKVTDFGLARLPGVGDGVDLTQVGMTLGTPLYMSPEQVEGQSLDPRSDIYSFGVTCYYMLAGSHPFGGETALSVAVQHLKKNPESLENLRSDLPPAICRIIHKMLAKSREDRYQSAHDLLRELRQLQLEHLDDEWPEDLSWEGDTLDLAASRFKTTQQLDTLMKLSSSTRSARRRLLIWGAGIAISLLLGGILAYSTALEPTLLLEAESQSTEVRQFDSVEGQWIHALNQGTEGAFRAVCDNFPQEDYWVYQAKKQLGLIYVKEENYQAALDVFKQLTSPDVPPEEKEIRAFGFAGQYFIYTRQADDREAEVARNELIISDLKDRVMAEILSRTSTDKSMQEYLETLAPPTDDTQVDPPVDSSSGT